MLGEISCAWNKGAGTDDLGASRDSGRPIRKLACSCESVLGAEIREFHVDGAGNQFVLPLRDVVKKESKESW